MKTTPLILTALAAALIATGCAADSSGATQSADSAAETAPAVQEEQTEPAGTDTAERSETETAPAGNESAENSSAEDSAAQTEPRVSHTGSGKIGLPDAVKAPGTPSYTAPEPGKWETYLTDFRCPDDACLVTEKNGSVMGVAFVGAQSFLYVDVVQQGSGSHLTYSSVYTGDDWYLTSDTDGQKKALHCSGVSGDPTSGLSNTINGKAEFREYAGEETIDGTVCDVLSAAIGETPVKIAFTKDGGFFRLESEEDGIRSYIYDAAEIAVPDAEWTESDEAAMLSENLAATLAFIAVSQAE